MTSDAIGSRALRVGVGLLVLAFCTAPVPGDVGGCNQRAEELDPETFFALKGSIDCDRCTECGFASDTCTSACAGEVDSTLPRGCLALVHDGEVCLRALLDASCSDYGAFVRDESPTAPTECNFCPRSSE